MNILATALGHVDYLVAVALFLIGAWILVTSGNLVKKVIGLNVMETSVFAFIVTTGMIDGGAPPLVVEGMEGPYASPLPHALVLTGIVVAVSITSLALVLILRVKSQFGSIELDEIVPTDEARGDADSDAVGGDDD
ncbi:MAG: cation:proton antiporter subunit C [Wenzhouxiangellaceae bacterium]|nr:cation:proton antiporter subunit C [Wenzhouxiangellaceae bacterium]MBS3746404.1 cation:proton antiporter subunit C [Wenzhouxiangellaceae bacterium]MBS3824062.1 cation:proton antiporter subunit C [Wenzhouxiangellaceae bacterium]